MVDEKLLKDINDVLKKIEILKNQDNIGETLAEYGIDILSLDENGIIETFDSILSAVKAGYKNVNKALKFGIKCKGFYFKYLED